MPFVKSCQQTDFEIWRWRFISSYEFFSKKPHQVGKGSFPDMSDPRGGRGGGGGGRGRWNNRFAGRWKWRGRGDHFFDADFT